MKCFETRRDASVVNKNPRERAKMAARRKLRPGTCLLGSERHENWVNQGLKSGSWKKNKSKQNENRGQLIKIKAQINKTEHKQLDLKTDLINKTKSCLL